MTKTNRSFFDTYPHEYDALTDAAKREKPHRREVRALILKFNPRSVLDAGCATGLTSRLFAERGIVTVGLDRSKVMLDIAAAKASAYKEILSFMYGHFESLPKSLRNRFDLVVCLANAIAGVGSLTAAREVLRNFRTALIPGGTLVLQALNFAAVREDEIMPVKVTRSDSIVYQRFVERKGKRLYLYVNRLDLARKPPSMEVFRHEMDNFSPDQLKSALEQVGFRNIRRYADLCLEKRFSKSSRDIVLTARKPVER